jgi:DNA-binding NarL/FixJ family response regulator
MSGGVRIFIADDDDDIRQMLHMRLEADPRFVVVGEAENGQVAVDRALELVPDVIILDLAMPVMDGLEALSLIRPGLPEVKIAILTGYGSSRLEKQALALGADVLLGKTSAIASLPDKLAALVNERSVEASQG